MLRRCLVLRNLSLSKNDEAIVKNVVSDNCISRIKPMMLSGVKTEALLVFARTALERFFIHIKENDLHPVVGSESDTEYVYSELKKLTDKLQECVVNADYLINIVQSAKKFPKLKEIAKHEEPLMNYYDVMAHKVANHFMNKPAYVPEFLVLCVLDYWIAEEERSTDLYPFLNEFNFSLMIEKFENSREDFKKDGECILSDIFNVSESIILKLKQKKYKVNKERTSKTRNKK